MGLKFVNVFKKMIPKREIPKILSNGKMVWMNPEHPDYHKIVPKPKLPKGPPKFTKAYAHATCPNCNANLLSGDVFCKGCGTEIDKIYKDTQSDNQSVPYIPASPSSYDIAKKMKVKPKGMPSDAPDITSDRRIGDGDKKKDLIPLTSFQTLPNDNWWYNRKTQSWVLFNGTPPPKPKPAGEFDPYYPRIEPNDNPVDAKPNIKTTTKIWK